MIDRWRLPKSGHHVYVLRDAAGGAIYIGQSENVARRIYTHESLAAWFPLVDSIELIRCTDLGAARGLERDLIWDLAPIANVDQQNRRRLRDRTVALLLERIPEQVPA